MHSSLIEASDEFIYFFVWRCLDAGWWGAGVMKGKGKRTHGKMRKRNGHEKGK